MEHEKKGIKKLISLIPLKRAVLRQQCIPKQTEEEVKRELEEFVKTYDPAMESIQYRLTHVPSKGILKRSSYCERAVHEVSFPECTDEEEPPKLFPTIKDSLEILLKKKSSICARKSILKNPSLTNNLASAVDIQQTSDDDELCLVAKFPAKDSMEILINKSKSCVKMSEAGDKEKKRVEKVGSGENKMVERED